MAERDKEGAEARELAMAAYERYKKAADAESTVDRIRQLDEQIEVHRIAARPLLRDLNALKKRAQLDSQGMEVVLKVAKAVPSADEAFFFNALEKEFGPIVEQPDPTPKPKAAKATVVEPDDDETGEPKPKGKRGPKPKPGPDPDLLMSIITSEGTPMAVILEKTAYKGAVQKVRASLQELADQGKIRVEGKKGKTRYHRVEG